MHTKNTYVACEIISYYYLLKNFKTLCILYLNYKIKETINSRKVSLTMENYNMTMCITYIARFLNFIIIT
jgi:hypothetical protein